MKNISFIIILFLIFSAGCTWHAPKEKSAMELTAIGMKAFDKKKYFNAIDSFEKLRDWYPFSKYAILAELKIADSHFYLKEYDEAVLAYKEFENLHPRNDVIPYIINQIGLCYVKQIDTIDRGQTPAKKGKAEFKRLLRQFPETEYSLKAKEHLKKCRESLAGHDLYVGLFYFKTKHYKAALYRFMGIVKEYPELEVSQEALSHIPLCESLIKEKKPE